MDKMNTFSRKTLSIIGSLLLMFVFAVSFRQAALYRINQNTYMLHGLANAGVGFLDLDWQAQTTDPVPVFSALVRVSVQIFSENAIYFLYMIILAVFCYSITGIAREVIGNGYWSVKHLSFFVLITLWYSGMLVGLILKIPGISQFAPIIKQNVLLTDGVAGQYILGRYFQPSTFGVFLILSIYSFIRERPYLAVISLVIASTAHSTYLLSSAVLTATYMGVIVVKDKDYRKAILLGAVTVILVLPILLYSYLNFRPTSTAIYAEAQKILIDYRIPHHAIVSNWFDGTTVFQIIVVVLSIYLVRRTKLSFVLLCSFLAALTLTAVQIFTGSKFLALLFPWRISVYLVPIASEIILAKIFSLRLQIVEKSFPKIIRPVQITLLGVILILGILGVRQTNKLRYTPRRGVTPAVKFVRSTFQPGDLYLIPIDIGSFRLAARVPVFIDQKSHPYKDTEVIEWFERLNIAHDFYTSSGDEACAILKNLTDEYEVNHVIFWSSFSLPNCENMQEIFSDEDLLIYKIQSDD